VIRVASLERGFIFSALGPPGGPPSPDTRRPAQ
jgi:hypothetical protein